MSKVNIRQLRHNVYTISNTLHVDRDTIFPTAEQTGSPARPFYSIQQAIDSTSIESGQAWQIRISEGVYSENLHLTSDCNFFIEGINPQTVQLTGDMMWVISGSTSRLTFVDINLSNLLISDGNISASYATLRLDNCVINNIKSTSTGIVEILISGLGMGNADQISDTVNNSMIDGYVDIIGPLIVKNTRLLSSSAISASSIHADGCAFSSNILLSDIRAEFNNSVWLAGANIEFMSSPGIAYFDVTSAFNFESIGGSIFGGTQIIRISTSGSFSAGGDLSGTPSSQNIAKLQGIPLDASSPSDGYSLVYSAGLGAISFKSVSSGGGGIGISAADHQALRQAIHFLPEGPAHGFLSGAFKETLTAGDPFPTSVIWWSSSAKTGKIFEIDITYNSNKTVSQVQYKMYSIDGTSVIETITDNITYINGIFETSVSRTIT